MKLQVTLLFCGLVLIQLGELLKREKIHHAERIHNSNSSFYTFEWLTMVSIKDCIEACKSRKACQYINYDVRPHLCALIRPQEGHEGNICPNTEIKPGYVYGNKSEWSMGAYTECDNCESFGKCPSGEDLEGKYNMCSNSGCGKSTDVGFHGNMFSPGSRIRQKCLNVSNVFPQSIALACDENGIWVTDHHKVCPNVSFDSSYYHLQTQSMSRNRAKASCESLSGHLVDINSEEELLFIVQLLKAASVTFSWTGATRADGEEWKWSDGSEVSWFTQLFTGDLPDDGDYYLIIISASSDPFGRIIPHNPMSFFKSVCEFH